MKHPCFLGFLVIMNKKGKTDLHYKSDEKMLMCSHRLLRALEKANEIDQVNFKSSKSIK